MAVCLCLCSVTAHLLAEAVDAYNCTLIVMPDNAADPGDDHSSCMPTAQAASAAPYSLTTAWLNSALLAWPHLAAPLSPPPKI